MNPHDIKIFLLDHIHGDMQTPVVNLLLLIGIAVAAVLSYYICKMIMRGIEVIVRHSPTKWDDDMVNDRFMRGISQLAPALIVDWLLPAFFTARDGATIHWLKTLTSLYILWAVVRIITITTGNLYNALHHRRNTRPYAVKGIFQMIKLITIGLGVIVGISILIGKEPAVVLTALGASAAILMLVFKDTILGLVASVQLTANNMLHKGDWIVADRHHANGEVEDVSLTTVKIRNWDNSISTIPPYALVSESFRNYQPMRDLGGRRVERSVFIDMNSVRFLTAAERDALAEEGWLNGLTGDEAGKVINLSLLRRYLESYLGSHPDVNDSMLIMVRQMEPTPSGLPLQLYFFTKSTAWKDFEKIQSDIFDHVYAVIHRFGLLIFQTPAGHDISASRIADRTIHNKQYTINNKQ